MQLINEAISVCMTTAFIRLDEALKAVLYNVGSDIKLRTKMVIVCKILTNSMQNYPVYFGAAPKERCWRLGPNFLNDPRASEL